MFMFCKKMWLSWRPKNAQKKLDHPGASALVVFVGARSCLFNLAIDEQIQNLLFLWQFQSLRI